VPQRRRRNDAARLVSAQRGAGQGEARMPAGSCTVPLPTPLAAKTAKEVTESKLIIYSDDNVARDKKKGKGKKKLKLRPLTSTNNRCHHLPAKEKQYG